MLRRSFPFFLAMVAVPLICIRIWAKANSGELMKATLNLDVKTSLGSKTLAPGQYRVIAEGNEAKFEQDGKVVAEVPCKMKTLSSKAEHTEFLTDQGRLTEIQVSGKTEAIDFGS